MDAVCRPNDPVAVSDRATHVAHAWLRAAVYRELESEAQRRRQHPDALAASIIVAAILLGEVDDLIARALASIPKV